MAQAKQPVPMPRRILPDKTSLEDKKPQTQTPQSGAARSPPPVPPKKFTVGGSLENGLEIVKLSERTEEKELALCPRPGPPAVNNPYCMSPASANQGLLITEKIQKVTICQTANDATNQPIYETVIKEETDHVVVVQQAIQNHKSQPPQPPVRPPVKDKPGNQQQDEILDDDCLRDWWEKVRSWNFLSQDFKSKEMEETKIISVKARRIYNAVQRYNLLLADHGGTLKEHIVQLVCIADNLDKVSKRTAIAGITGGATGVAGGVAAAGLILAPFTFGASLALTAVGVGVAAAGGVTAASAAIANKVTVSQDKKKIENIFQEHEDLMVKIRACLKFINEGMGQLKQHNLSALRAAEAESARVARVTQLATTDGPTAKAIEASSKASGVMEGFALGMFFTQKKNETKLKKGFESKLGEKIRQVVKAMDEGLKELMQIKKLFSQII